MDDDKTDQSDADQQWNHHDQTFAKVDKHKDSLFGTWYEEREGQNRLFSRAKIRCLESIRIDNNPADNRPSIKANEKQNTIE